MSGKLELERMSHPVRVRGLKLGTGHPLAPGGTVAPRAGAWVETLQTGHQPTSTYVAPRAGAWVETHLPDGMGTNHRVAPRAGAWVETEDTITILEEA